MEITMWNVAVVACVVIALVVLKLVHDAWVAYQRTRQEMREKHGRAVVHGVVMCLRARAKCTFCEERDRVDVRLGSGFADVINAAGVVLGTIRPVLGSDDVQVAIPYGNGDPEHVTVYRGTPDQQARMIVALISKRHAQLVWVEKMRSIDAGMS